MLSLVCHYRRYSGTGYRAVYKRLLYMARRVEVDRTRSVYRAGPERTTTFLKERLRDAHARRVAPDRLARRGHGRGRAKLKVWCPNSFSFSRGGHGRASPAQGWTPPGGWDSWMESLRHGQPGLLG